MKELLLGIWSGIVYGAKVAICFFFGHVEKWVFNGPDGYPISYTRCERCEEVLSENWWWKEPYRAWKGGRI